MNLCLGCSSANFVLAGVLGDFVFAAVSAAGSGTLRALPNFWGLDWSSCKVGYDQNEKYVGHNRANMVAVIALSITLMLGCL